MRVLMPIYVLPDRFHIRRTVRTVTFGVRAARVNGEQVGQDARQATSGISLRARPVRVGRPR